MGNFFTDPFGGSFAGRIYTKVAKSAAGDTSYSVLHPERNNSVWSKSKSSNDRFADYDNKKDVPTARKFMKNEFGESVPINRNQNAQQPSTWQKIKTAVSNWWNKDSSSKNNEQVCNPNATLESVSANASRFSEDFPEIGQ